MKNLDLIQSFGKGLQVKKNSGKNAIVYTRVSSKEQTENLSLDVQAKGCAAFAARNSFEIKGVFGGTYESAQSDERKEFQRMVSFAKNSKERISCIIVYSLERFSRTGENAIWLSRQLRELGISIVSVSQPIDTTNPSGVLQQNILFLFSQYDNDLRRQKCIDGMREKLLRGEWVGVAPMGYKYDRSDYSSEKKYQQKIVIDERGKYIRKAFELKAYDQLSNTQIFHIINKMGFKLTMQRLCEMLRNPFYCGCISHNILEGRVVKGKHEPIISEEVFLLANEVLKSRSQNAQGYKQQKLQDSTPLKQFVYCGDCGTAFTSYIVKSKNLWYYKCNRIGCKCNKSAKHLHQRFEDLLAYYTFHEKFIPPTVDEIAVLYFKRSTQSLDETAIIKTKITELEKEIYTIEERHALGRTNDDVFNRVITQKLKEKEGLEKSINESFINLSNPYKVITEAVEKVANLRDLWVSQSTLEKDKFQNLCFPGGIHYDRKIDNYRTQNVNPIIKQIEIISGILDKKKADKPKSFLDLSASVAPAGIEPASSESESEILSIEIRSQILLRPISLPEQRCKNNQTLQPKKSSAK